MRWCFQFDFLLLIFAKEKLQEDAISRLHLHLLLWSPVAVTEHANNGSELPLGLVFAQLFRSKLQLFVIWMLIHLPDHWVVVKVSQVCIGSVETMADNSPQLVSTIHVVSLRRLHQTESINITNIGLTLWPQEVKSADTLLESFLHLSCYFLLLWRQIDRVSDLLACWVPLDHAIKCWTFPCLSMCILAANRVYLDIESIGREKLFVDVGTVRPDSWLVWNLRNELAWQVVCFSE